LIRVYQAQWQSDAEQYRNELNSIDEKMIEWKEQEKYYTVVAPLSGSIQNLSGLQKGAAVFSNQKIAELSPDSLLIAVCYVSPANIGLLKKGQSVRFMVDAFDYNQWGVAEGNVLDISDDIVLSTDNRPTFKIKCKLNKKYLSLSNGYKGNLSKGMSFNASFFVARRSLFQLLYEKADKWLNPGISINS